MSTKDDNMSLCCADDLNNIFKRESSDVTWKP